MDGLAGPERSIVQFVIPRVVHVPKESRRYLTPCQPQHGHGQWIRFGDRRFTNHYMHPGCPTSMAPDHRLSHETALHTSWDNDRDPALTVEPGETVAMACLDANGPRLTPKTQSGDLPDSEFVGHHLTGPIRVAGAEPGDVLAVDILDVETDDWGYTVIRSGDRGVGLLPERFPDPFVYHWQLADGVGLFEHGIEVPLAPFPGVVGVAPAAPGEHGTGPPRAVGGNLDIKHLTAGATVYLPVAVNGALCSIGDGHAAQGDGEVCVSAIEAPMEITVRFELQEGRSIPSPQFETTGPFHPAGHTGDDAAYATTGIADDLMVATKDATNAMIDHLVERYALTPEHAYVLCSVAGDLKINEVVDAPNWVVSMYLAQELFPDDR